MKSLNSIIMFEMFHFSGEKYDQPRHVHVKSTKMCNLNNFHFLGF